MRTFLLRGVRNLARLLGCDETAAVLQYHDVLPYMLKEMAPSRPLAECSNQEAWGRLLDRDVWEAACPGRFHGAASGALSRMIRFYSSIEDGGFGRSRLKRFRVALPLAGSEVTQTRLRAGKLSTTTTWLPAGTLGFSERWKSISRTIRRAAKPRTLSGGCCRSSRRSPKKKSND